MSPQNIPLDRLRDHQDFSPGRHPSRLNGTTWALPKRPFSALVIAFAFLTALYFFFRSPPTSTPTPPHLPSKLSPTHSPSYLLGETEDATKLWFPPSSAIDAHFYPPVATYNLSPEGPQRLRTPLFIAFTRNSAMLQQTVLSYIAAGWPRSDIIIVDNSGTMDANSRGQLSSKNPFFLDYDLFRHRYGVSILQTPTLLTFAQLMNFYLRVSMAYEWRFFFWSHMDIAVVSNEADTPYKSFHQRILEILSDLDIHKLDAGSDLTKYEHEEWALKYFTYDWLTLINVPAWRKIGAWDTFIPYYASDCDAYSRIVLNGLTKDDVRAGRIFDLAEAIPDPESKFFPASSSPPSPTANNLEDDPRGISAPGSKRYHALVSELDEMQNRKTNHQRNSWQDTNNGGKGEPWTYDPKGFQKMWWSTAQKGRDMYQTKWGTQECRLDEHGFKLSDAWEHA